MRRMSSLSELNGVPPEIAWRLVDSLYLQTGPLIAGAVAFMLLGIVGFIGTGSYWYLGGASYSIVMCAFRLWQCRQYKLFRGTASQVAWAKRCLWAGCLTSAGCSAWSATVVFEPNHTLVLMSVGVVTGYMIGAAVRNCAVPLIADVQVFLMMVPMFVSCVAALDIYFDLYAVFIAMHTKSALSLIRFLHGQSLRLLLQEKEKSQLVERLEAANEKLEELAATDALTGLANRRCFDLTSAREWRRGARKEAPLSVLLLDVDQFKLYNDFYGHPAGDECLRQIATAVTSVVRRPGDLVARYGGEEFIVILPNTYLDDAVQLAERVRQEVEAGWIRHETSTIGHVTVSIGAACMVPNQIDKVLRLTEAADVALYAAKRGGRNRVHASEASTAAPIDITHELSD